MSALQDKIRVALRARPMLSYKAIAAELGCSISLVSNVASLEGRARKRGAGAAEVGWVSRANADYIWDEAAAAGVSFDEALNTILTEVRADLEEGCA